MHLHLLGATVNHFGFNYIGYKQSIKLQSDYKLLGETIERLGKICVMSGLIPTLRRNSEMFSHIYRAVQWLSNFLHLTFNILHFPLIYDYISHFDSFWNKNHLYKHDILDATVSPSPPNKFHSDPFTCPNKLHSIPYPCHCKWDHCLSPCLETLPRQCPLFCRQRQRFSNRTSIRHCVFT